MSKYLWLALAVAGMAPSASAAGAFSISASTRVGFVPRTTNVRVNVPKNAHNRLVRYGFTSAGGQEQMSERQLDGEDSPGVFFETWTVKTPGTVAFWAVLVKDNGEQETVSQEACYSGGETECK